MSSPDVRSTNEPIVNSHQSPSSRRKRRESRSGSQRAGVIVVLAAFLMIMMMAFLAFSIDLGYMGTVDAEMQRAVDSGALAGAAVLGDGPAAATIEAQKFVGLNPTGQDDTINSPNITVEFGNWDLDTRTFQPGVEPLIAIRVEAMQPARPLFFARILGHQSFDGHASAVATYQPRDIVVVLDYSASMNDDSELGHIAQLGQVAIEANLFEIYQELGAPVFGNMQFAPVQINSTNSNIIAQQLGLTNVPYPYPGGSWPSYFQYVQTSAAIRNAGYRNKYGYLTWVNYLLERQPQFSQTPDLYLTSEQPITAVKDALAVFTALIRDGGTDDRIGLAIYTSADGTGKLEVPLTQDFDLVEQTSRQRQAGHYDSFTNIGAGMQKAREELEQNGRDSAVKLIVLMTDGIANRPNSVAQAKQYVRNESQNAANDHFPICTISLGAAADKALMQEVADTTSGVHFNIPGGQSVADYEEDLQEAFRKIADFRPVRLVQ
ncbi:MAG: VWA domain-containing protein [Pirellulaceae bacterium]|nr:VWA domain-containing protein [Planctomycetales bacterium]